MLALAFASIQLPLLYTQANAQTIPTPASPAKAAAIKSFRMIQEKDGPAVEILSTRPLIPEIQVIQNPTRLVIDLPNARIESAERRVQVQADHISALRASQFQDDPPMARIVVDLQAPRTFTWSAAGNRLVVRLGMIVSVESHSPFEPASLKETPPPVIKTVRASGPLVLASDAGSVGSSFTAGADTAVLRLSTGGEVRVCPGTTVSITPSENRHNLLLGMNSGGIEAHLQLDDSADLIMTPDFRIALEGPGEFHYAFSSEKNGDTCVRALPGNTISATATELLDAQTYHVKPTEQVVFRGGRVDRIDTKVPLECGCPPPRQNIERAQNDLPVQGNAASEARPPTAPNSPPGENSAAEARSGIPAGNSEPGEASPANELHVQVTAPLVFHASGPPPPAPVENAEAAPLEIRPTTTAVTEQPNPPIAAKPAKVPATNDGLTIETKTAQPGFFGKVRRFFAKIFH
jgi:hypothetical protein